jgi:NAD(P)-dependent dehydrogenase (short-subunit alcohol dehydrogenase family)
MPNISHYVAAKAGVIGFMRSLALELAPESIRVNTVNPSIVSTDMIHNPFTYGLFVPGVAQPSRDQAAEVFATLNPLPTPWVDVEDVSNAVVFLAGDQSRFITGQELKVDAGFGIN